MTQEPTTQDFAQQLERVATSADRDAFGELFAHFAPRIKTWLMRAGCNDAIANELSQETMLAVWHRAGSYRRDRAAVSTWIFTLARNKRVDRIRRERHPTVDWNNSAFVKISPGERSYGWDVLAGEHSRLEERIESLPEEQTTILRKIYVEDKSHSMIAVELSIALGTVKSRLRLALQSLRVLYEEEPG
jgi:RNA polymerase sigma-70 factor (ECF subfamily)